MRVKNKEQGSAMNWKREALHTRKVCVKNT
jgi:hypothetical protein